jgi:hypothetical protein
MMVQDLVGGEIIAGQVGMIPHYWVRMGGLDIDITGDQFDKPTIQAKKGRLYGGGEHFQRQRYERLNQKANRAVMRLYDRLRSRLVPVLRKQGEDEIAAHIEAMA